jgi:hypothetical protein
MEKGLYDYIAGPYLMICNRPVRRVEVIEEHDGIVEFDTDYPVQRLRLTRETFDRDFRKV